MVWIHGCYCERWSPLSSKERQNSLEMMVSSFSEMHTAKLCFKWTTCDLRLLRTIETQRQFSSNCLYILSAYQCAAIGHSVLRPLSEQCDAAPCQHEETDFSSLSPRLTCQQLNAVSVLLLPLSPSCLCYYLTVPSVIRFSTCFMLTFLSMHYSFLSPKDYSKLVDVYR